MTTADAAAPAWTLLGAEPLRAAFEYLGMRFMDPAGLPRGDGHPVVIFPGLASDRRATAPLHDFCSRLGYAAHDWGRGWNTGPRGEVEPWLDELAAHVRELVAPHAGRVSLIGWSLGGLYAREVAKKLGVRARQVITIGTPFAGPPSQTRAAWLYRVLSGQAPAYDAALAARLRTPPEVPTTSIYSRSDGVVAWQACVQPGRRAHTENIEVDGSHCGLGWNTEVLRVIADRLAQPEQGWQRYARRP